MGTARLVLLALWVAMLAACCTVQSPTTRNVVAGIENDTVELLDDDGALKCSGVWVGPHEILTASHCVRFAGAPQELMDTLTSDDDDAYDGSDGKAWDPIGYKVSYENLVGDNRYRATVVFNDHDGDLALLETRFAHSSRLLSQNVVRDGDEMHVVGHTAGLLWTYEHAYVSQTQRLIQTMPDSRPQQIMLQIQSPIWGGNSGGGAYDLHGDLVGICSMRSGKAAGLGFFIPRDNIEKFLTEAHLGETHAK